MDRLCGRFCAASMGASETAAKSQDVDAMRQLLDGPPVIGGGIALLDVLFTQLRRLSAPASSGR